MKVSQEAREAAADITLSHLKGGLNWMHAQGVHDKIVAGKWDHHPVAQAFAAFEQSIRDKLEGQGECICPKCGIRHGGAKIDGEPQF